MKKNIEKKSLIVNDISILLKDSMIISLVSYVGIKSFDLKVLRRDLKTRGIIVKVVKNSLAKRIFTFVGYDRLIDNLSGQLLIVASKDIFSMLLALEKIKKSNDNFVVIRTAICNCLASDLLIKELLSFGSETNVVSKLVYVLRQPLLNFVNLLKLPVSNLTNAIRMLEKGENNVN